jgi:hypothetical protein
MRHGQGPLSLDLAQRKTDVQAFQVGQVLQHIQSQVGESIHVRRHHLQLEGGRAGVAVGVDTHKGQHAEPACRSRRGSR